MCVFSHHQVIISVPLLDEPIHPMDPAMWLHHTQSQSSEFFNVHSPAPLTSVHPPVSTHQHPLTTVHSPAPPHPHCYHFTHVFLPPTNLLTTHIHYCHSPPPTNILTTLTFTTVTLPLPLTSSPLSHSLLSLSPSH